MKSPVPWMFHCLWGGVQTNTNQGPKLPVSILDRNSFLSFLELNLLKLTLTKRGIIVRRIWSTSWHLRVGTLARHLEGPVWLDSNPTSLGHFLSCLCLSSCWSPLFSYFQNPLMLFWTHVTVPNSASSSQAHHFPIQAPSRDWQYPQGPWVPLRPGFFPSPVSWPGPILTWVFTPDFIGMVWSQCPGACCPVRGLRWPYFYQKKHGGTGKLTNRPTSHTSLWMLQFQIWSGRSTKWSEYCPLFRK